MRRLTITLSEPRYLVLVTGDKLLLQDEAMVGRVATLLAFCSDWPAA